jgi:hypothetical protein
MQCNFAMILTAVLCMTYIILSVTKYDSEISQYFGLISEVNDKPTTNLTKNQPCKMFLTVKNK